MDLILETTRKRRYSDPSGSPDDPNSRMSNGSQASNKQEKPKSEYRNWNVVGASAESHSELYDATNGQWPTLTSQVDPSSPRNVAANRVDSYASKLKTNLDSRGCSLASSSEDSSSSSSSSANGYQGRSADRASPVHNYFTALSDISRTIQAAAGFVKIEQTTRDPVSVESLQPVNATSSAVAIPAKSAEKVKAAEAAKQTSLKQSNDAAGSIKTAAPLSVPSLSPDPIAASVVKQENTPAFELKTSKCIDASSAVQTDTILNELQNNFGLSFFMDESSLLNDDVPDQLHDSANFKSGNMQVTFGDGDLCLDEMSEVALSDEKAITSHTVRIPSLNVDVEFQETTNWLKDVGDFDLKKATSTLMQGKFWPDLFVFLFFSIQTLLAV